MKRVVLLVDDEAVVRRIAKLALEKDGFEVLEADDAPAALALAEAREIDLLVSDLHLPSMDGVELVVRISSIRPAVRALLISGELEAPETLPNVDFLGKPFSSARLVEKARESLA